MVINGISPQKLAFWNAWGKIGFGEEICLFFCLGGTETALCEISMFHSLWFKEVRFSLRRWSRNYLWLRCRFGRLLMCGFTVDGTTKDVSVIVCWVVRCSTCLTATSHTTRERRVAVKWVKRRIDKWDQVTMLSLSLYKKQFRVVQFLLIYGESGTVWFWWFRQLLTWLVMSGHFCNMHVI